MGTQVFAAFMAANRWLVTRIEASLIGEPNWLDLARKPRLAGGDGRGRQNDQSNPALSAGNEKTMNYSKLFRVKPGAKLSLAKVDPNSTAEHRKKKKAAKQVEKLDRRLRELQYMLYSEGKRSLLICLQALDAAGKDGAINHVLGSMNPQGTRVHGFKAPTEEEKQHDFLWRIQQQVPKPGEVVIFNRSHYEDVLVVRVHNLVPQEVWEKRYDQINQFEKQLVAGGIRILKFFLHISPEEQLERFKLRLDDPARHWKISESDYAEREFWDDYTRAYEDALSKTSTKHAPWFIIPSNNKWFRNLAVAKIVAEAMESLGMKLPRPKVNVERIRQKYHRAEEEEIAKIGKKKWKKLLAKEKKKAKPDQKSEVRSPKSEVRSAKSDVGLSEPKAEAPAGTLPPAAPAAAPEAPNAAT
jgi:PPK2 family polyphosphate:nucleotide phosphotransferase